MLKKWWVAGILAGLVVFLWGFVGHMVFKLGDSSFRKLPQEESMLTAMAAGIPEPGLYFFPYDEDMAKMEQLYARHPHGILLIQRAGTKFNFPAALAGQLIFDIVKMLIAAWLLWMAASAVTGFGARVIFVVAMSLFAFFATEAPYWNWYEFPTRFIMDGLIDKVVGAALGGAILAWLLGRKP